MENKDMVLYWAQKYEEHKHDCFCLDIEFTENKDEIALIGLYKPQSGEVETLVFIRDQNLTKEELKKVFKGCKMIITYNGLHADIPVINKAFPGVIPKDVIVIDLYRWARNLNLDTNLKVLEHTLGIERLHSYTDRRFIAKKLWKRYKEKNDKTALQKLIEYNKQDTINLYPIAEKLAELAKSKT